MSANVSSRARAGAGTRLAILLVAASSSTTLAQELEYDLRVDAPVTAVATAAWVGTELAKGTFAPASCRWCDRAPDGTDAVNGLDASVRAALKWRNIDAGDTASGVTGFGLTPVATLGLCALAAFHDDRLSGFPVDALVIWEAVALAADLNQAVKFTAGRERPFVHALVADEKPLTRSPSDNNTSFYSGHTSFAFSLAVSAATVAFMRGYRWRVPILVAGLAAAFLTGYLRIAGDRHYFIDVATGAVLGSAFGFAVPYFFHRPSTSGVPALSLVPLSSGMGIAARWEG